MLQLTAASEMGIVGIPLRQRAARWRNASACFSSSANKCIKNVLTEAVFNDETRKGFPADLIKVARRKLGYLNAAATLDDLRVPPANRLEALKGDRRGQHSIRVNDQFRICFIWTPEGPKDVEFVDYH